MQVLTRRSGINTLSFSAFRRISKIRFHATWLLTVSLIASVAALFLYFLDINYSDSLLFFFLAVIRSLGFIICLCSIYKLTVNVYHTFRRPSGKRINKMLLYLLYIAYGVFIIIFSSFITEIARGNV